MHEKLSSALLGRAQVRPPNLPVDAWFGRLTLPPKVEFWLESRLLAAEGRIRPPKVPDFRLWSGTFGRRRCRRKCPSFVSGERVRPPKVPPKVPCPAFSRLFSMHV